MSLEEYSRKIEQLEELVNDQINRNARSTLIICGVKFNLHNEKSWNDTENCKVKQNFYDIKLIRRRHQNKIDKKLTNKIDKKETLKMFWQPLYAPSSVGTNTSLHMIQNGHITEITKIQIPQFMLSFYLGKLHKAY